MIIDLLRMKNFKRFRDEEIRFSDGITGILGNNGTGKSSIVEAIFFALYGVQATGISGDYIVSSFAPPKEKCEVRLDFRIGGDSYTVVRMFKKGKAVSHDAKFFANGKQRAEGVSSVEIEVRRTLGMGPVDFRNTVYAAQKDLLTLLENTPGKRKEWFLRALGIEYLNAGSQKILKEQADAKDRELQMKEGELKGLAERQDPAALQELQASVISLGDAIRELRAQQAGLGEKKGSIESALARFREKKTEYLRLTDRYQALDKEIGNLSEQRDRIKAELLDIADQEEEYGALGQRLSSYEAKKGEIEELRKLKSEYEHLSADLQYAGRDSADLKERSGKAREKILSLDREAARLASLFTGLREIFSIGPEVPDHGIEHEIAEREAELRHSAGHCSARARSLADEKAKLLSDRETIRGSGADGVCPLCRQTLGAHYTSIEEEFGSRLEQIEKEIGSCRQDQEKAGQALERIAAQRPAVAEIRSITEHLKSREHLEPELRELLSRLEEKEAAVQALRVRIQDHGYDEAGFARTEKEMKDLETLQVRFGELGKSLARGEALMNEAKRLCEEIARKQDELARLKSEIDRSACDPGTGVQLEQDLAGTEDAIRITGTEIVRATERLSHAEEKIAAYRKEEVKIAELKDSVSVLKEEIELLKLTRSVISDYVVYLMQVVRSRLEGEVSRIVGEITGGKYEQVLLDAEFNLLIRDIDNDYPVDRFSGGEQDDIAVALRIALSRYLAELHQVHESTILIFDEIFGSQDEERRMNLLTALRTQESRFPQIVLISHIPEMQGEFSNTLFVELGSDLSSRVREVT
jgi:exonuclease SbcC